MYSAIFWWQSLEKNLLSLTSVALAFASFLKMMTTYSPLRHRLAFSPSHIDTCFLLLFLGETSCLVITEMSGEKNHFPPEREKIKYSKRENSLRSLEKAKEVILCLMTPGSHGRLSLVLMVVLDTLTGKAVHKRFRLFSLICMYRTKTQTMAISYKRKSIKCKELFYLVQILYLCMTIDKWQSLFGHYSPHFLS